MKGDNAETAGGVVRKPDGLSRLLASNRFVSFAPAPSLAGSADLRCARTRSCREREGAGRQEQGKGRSKCPTAWSTGWMGTVVLWSGMDGWMDGKRGMKAENKAGLGKT